MKTLSLISLALFLSACAQVYKPAPIVLAGKPNTCEPFEVRPTWRSNVVAIPCFDKHGNMTTPAALNGVTGAELVMNVLNATAVGVGVWSVFRSPLKLQTKDEITVQPGK